jgi:O-succinylbenzoate synthase
VTTGSSSIQQVAAVKSVVLHRVRVPFVEPFRISNGVVAEKESILIEVTNTDEVTGWGECAPMAGSFYSADTPDSSWQALTKELVPWLLESRTVDPDRAYEQLRELPGDAFAKAGIDGALWDLYAKARGISLCQALGISERAVPSGVAIGIFDTVDELLERVRLYVAQGYRRVKIKIQPGWDVEPVARIREEFPALPLMVDANGAYSIVDVASLRELDQFGLMMIEQPLAASAIDEAGELQSQLKTPLCADESADSIAAVEQLIEIDAARVINIKVQRVGGLSAALVMLHVARAAGLRCWVGTMPELGIASAQALHFAMHTGFTFPTDIEASTRWYADDVIEPLIEIDRKGFIHVPQGAGMGFSVSRVKVDQYATASEAFRL